jgi:hypothetical protein
MPANITGKLGIASRIVELRINLRHELAAIEASLDMIALSEEGQASSAVARRHENVLRMTTACS